MVTRIGTVLPRTDFGGAGWRSSSSVTLASAVPMASLMRRQLCWIRQRVSWWQAPSCTLHSVMPIGPSMAVTMSSTEMALAGRASR